jgi:hypothetical protein
MTQCTARAFVFSGRPDPEWLIQEQQIQRLETLWNQLPPCLASTSSQSGLGYRGVSMVCTNNEEYIAFGGYVKKKISNSVELKKDTERLFEKLLLSTAPQGLFPADIGF